MFNPVSAAKVSLICLVGLGVFEKAVLRISSCLALIVVLGPLLLVPPGVLSLPVELFSSFTAVLSSFPVPEFDPEEML